MRPNVRIRPQGCLNTVALVLASITFSMGLWAGFCVAVGLIDPYQMPVSVCHDAEPYTDTWITCEYGEEMDLTPIQDEAQTTEGAST